jgi:hypothetical protein
LALGGVITMTLVGNLGDDILCGVCGEHLVTRVDVCALATVMFQ